MSCISDLIIKDALRELLSWIEGHATEPDTGLTPLARAILEYNNGLLFFKLAASYTVALKGVVIHKIDAVQAAAVAEAIAAGAKEYDLDPCFLSGCLLIESTGDPNCQNGNLGPGESNTQNDPLGYDMGVAQLKLRYLVGSAQGVSDAADARAFALDITQAIPYFCSLMAGKVAYAKTVIAKNTSSVPDKRLNNPYLLATGMYNFGDTGMVENYYVKGLFPSHCQQVEDLTNYAAKATGQPSIFGNL
ncbi:MAG: hypothetical protein WCC84_14760 [Candidatus Cybelea sp.]